MLVLATVHETINILYLTFGQEYAKSTLCMVVKIMDGSLVING